MWKRTLQALNLETQERNGHARAGGLPLQPLDQYGADSPFALHAGMDGNIDKVEFVI